MDVSVEVGVKLLVPVAVGVEVEVLVEVGVEVDVKLLVKVAVAVAILMEAPFKGRPEKFSAPPIFDPVREVLFTMLAW